MKIENLPFVTTDWNNIDSQKINGETGYAIAKTFEQGNIRVRKVEYSAGYKADHWCTRGHVVLVLDGEITVEIDDGRKYVLSKGMSFQAADDIDAHKAFTAKGANVFIVD